MQSHGPLRHDILAEVLDQHHVVRDVAQRLRKLLLSVWLIVSSKQLIRWRIMNKDIGGKLFKNRHERGLFSIIMMSIYKSLSDVMLAYSLLFTLIN